MATTTSPSAPTSTSTPAPIPTSEATIELRRLIGDARTGMFTTTTPSGELHSRPLTLGSIADDGGIEILVDGTADWVEGLTATESVNLAVADDDAATWVSIAGTASVDDDRAAIDRLWSPAAELFFPGGVDSPELRVLTVEPGTVEYWDAPSSRIVRLAMAAGARLGRTDGRPGESGTIEFD